MYNVAEVSFFGSSDELEEAYHASNRLEVRAGIIYALLHESYDEFPTDWKNRFMLRVCRENIYEAGRLDAFNKATPYPGADVHAEKMLGVINQKKAWILKIAALAKMATQCIAPLMSAYVDYRGIILKSPETEVDRNAERVLKLISEWDSAPFLSLRTGTTGKMIPKFLQTYRRQNESPPDAWFQGVIHSQNFHLFRCETAMALKIEEQIALYLRRSVLLDGHSEENIIRVENTRGIHSHPAADFLIEHLCMTGRLDPILAQL